MSLTVPNMEPCDLLADVGELLNVTGRLTVNTQTACINNKNPYILGIKVLNRNDSTLVRNKKLNIAMEMIMAITLCKW